MTQKTKLEYTLGKRVIVVLGAGLFEDGTPWPATMLRATKAAELAKVDKQATIICSGDGRSQANRHLGITEAVTMAQIIMLHGIDPRRIRLDRYSVDTIGNAVVTSALHLHRRKPRPIAVVTSPFHAERAALAFRGVLGPDWPVKIVLCEPAKDDAYRLTTETVPHSGHPTSGVEWVRRFFEPVTPGNLPQIVRRLFEIGKPVYRELPFLTRLARKAA